MKGLRGLLVLAMATSSMTPALAGPNRDAKIACHLVARVPKSFPCEHAPKPPCNPSQHNFVVHGELLRPYDLYLLVVDGDSLAGIAGAEFGIDYEGDPHRGLDVFGWTLCADVDFGAPWPSAGSGNIIIWNSLTNCQKGAAVNDLNGGVTAVMGSLYVYAFSNDVFRITKRPSISPPILAVVGCGPFAVRDTLEFPEGVGSVAFGQAKGELDPCRANRH